MIISHPMRLNNNQSDGNCISYIKNFFIYGLGQVFNLISPLIIAPLVIAKCQDSGYGKVGLGFAMALFLILIVDYAFDIKGIKSVSENRHESNVLEQLFVFLQEENYRVIPLDELLKIDVYEN